MISCLLFFSICCVSSTGFHLRSFHFLQRSNELDTIRRKPLLDASVNDLYKPYTAVMIVPTGVGASVGGYAGDALPSAKLLSSAVDVLITHPNVMNGAMLYWPVDNILYVEGSSLDAFAANKLYLEPLIRARGQKIGLLLDRGIEKDLMLRHIQVAESMKATLGLDISHIVITSRPAKVSTKVSEYSGASWGSVENIESLIDGARRLKELGCTAIAVVARFPEEDDDIHASSESDHSSSEGKTNKTVAEFFGDYRKGEGVDAIAGVEAIISRLISQQVGLPCAHAPAFSPMEVDEEVSPKAAAEEIGYTFLPCVLAYLHRTPNLIRASDHDKSIPRRVIRGTDVDAVIVPYNALGGPAVLSFLSQGKLIIAVLENETSMNVTKEGLLSLVIEENQGYDRVVIVRSYAEAAGFLLAHKNGINFESITSKVSKIPVERL